MDYKPLQAVIVYECEEKHSKEYYLESRRIALTKKGYQMMEGIPMNDETLAELSQCIKTREVDRINCKGFLPKNLLYFNENNFKPNLIWYLPKSKRHLSFKKELGIKDGNYNLPALIFKLSNELLSVFAIKDVEVTEKTKLYAAPFHNVHGDGSICLGSAIVKKSNELTEIIKNYEDAFFMSRFSHYMNQGSPIKGNLNTYFKQLKTNEFDNDLLVEKKIIKTLKELL